MDKLIRGLFNEGINDGDITIICQDNVKLQCHSLVMKHQSDFFKSLFSFNTQKEAGKANDCTLLYDSNIIKLLINKLYNSNYPIPELTLEEVIAFVKLIDELLILDRDDIRKSMMFSFKLLLNRNNWLTVLEQIYNLNGYADFVKECMIFFRDNILIGSDFVKNDPLENVDMNSKLGKELCCVMRNKIDYLNKQLGYTQPYIKKPLNNKRHAKRSFYNGDTSQYNSTGTTRLSTGN